jgi:hypothetical protein
LDTDITPLGERSWRTILQHVLEEGDRAETRYLEVKSAIDFTASAGRAKVAKFLLGAANRMLDSAMRDFHGYAVLVIGAELGRAEGIPGGVEPHELEDQLRPYLGTGFPQWELGRLPAENGREILFVVAPPPKLGQPIYPCRKSFHPDGKADKKDELTDGAIYVRGPSNTRFANAGEVDELVARARGGGKPPLDLDLQIFEFICFIDRLDEVLELLYDREERKHREPPAQSSRFLAGIKMPGLSSGEVALSDWLADRSENVRRGRNHLVGAGLSGLRLSVSSVRYVAKPRLTITFRDCEACDYIAPENARHRFVVPPIPETGGIFNALQARELETLSFRHRNDPVSWENVGSDALVSIELDSLRPNSPWLLNSNDLVIRARTAVESVDVQWVITEEGNDQPLSGEVALRVEQIDAAELYFSLFGK